MGIGLAVLVLATGCGEADVGAGVEAATEADAMRCPDDYEAHGDFSDNDAIDRATQLEDIHDTGGNFWIDTKLGADEEDWYRLVAHDHLVRSLEPLVSFVDYTPRSSRHGKVVTDRFEVCAFSTLPPEDVACVRGPAVSYQGMAGCCAVPDEKAPNDIAELRLDIDSVLYDDTSEIYIRVRPQVGAQLEACSYYALGALGYVY